MCYVFLCVLFQIFQEKEMKRVSIRAGTISGLFLHVFQTPKMGNGL